MWKTALLLLVTIIIIPFIAFTIDTHLNPAQQEILYDLLWMYVIAASLCFIISSSGNSRKRKEDCWKPVNHCLTNTVKVLLIQDCGELSATLIMLQNNQYG